MSIREMLSELRRWLSQNLSVEPERRTGFWLYTAHLCTIWGIALANTFQGLMFLWCFRPIRKWRFNWALYAPLLIPLGLYAITLTVSVAVSAEIPGSLSHLREILSLTTLVLALFLVRGEQEVRKIVDILIPMTTIVALYGIGQYFLTDYGTLYNRIPGPFSHYMTFSGVLLIGDFLLVARMASGQGWRKPRHWLALIAINLGLLLSLTRGSWVAVILTLTALFLVRGRRFSRIYLGFVLILLLFGLFGPDTWLERLRSIGDLRDPSNYDRLCMIDAGLYMVSERPLFGVGPGMVKTRYPIYRHHTAPRFNLPHLHNTFLQLAAERGLLTLAAYLALMTIGLTLTFRAYHREGGSEGPRADLYLGTLLVLIGFNLNGLFEDNWRDTELQRLILFQLAVPLCLQADRLPEDDTPSPSQSEPEP